MNTLNQIRHAVTIGMIQRRLDLLVWRELEHLKNLYPEGNEDSLFAMAIFRVANDFKTIGF